jgi:hypothetical protein
MHTIAGTPGFIAPQVLSQMFVRGTSAGYDGRSADVWSAGAVLCKLLTGHLPYGFEAEFDATLDMQAALHRVWAAARAAPLRDFVDCGGGRIDTSLDDDALTALEAMMACDEAARPSAAECAALPWFAKMAARQPAAFAAALARAQAAQAAVEAAHAADPPRRLGARKTAPGEWQDGAMRAFVARAAAAGPRAEAVECLTLLSEAGASAQTGGSAQSPGSSAARLSTEGASPRASSTGGGGGGGGRGAALAPAAPAAAEEAEAVGAAVGGAAAA